MRRLLAYAAIYLLWGGSFLAIRHTVALAPPFLAAGVRFLLAGAILYAFSRFRGAPPPDREQWTSGVLLGLVMFTGNYACLFWSEKFLTSGLAAVLTSLIPVWILLGEWLFLRSIPMTTKAFLGILLGIGGVVLLTLPAGVSNNGSTKAAFILLLGTLFWSVGTLASRRLRLPKQPTMSASLLLVCGGGFLVLLSAATGEPARLRALAPLWDWRLVLSMGYLILASSVLGFTAYVWLISREPAARVASYAYVNPVVALFLGFAVGHERPTPIEYAGMLLVLAGVFSTLTSKGAIESAPIETAA